eukprot:CAMPEP_0184308512 /NCGR_PEP_ID=MMETSP1049-20130417/16942_1 /TAXON_ID=77928 /ORGANISM="Proteomonas sulcata, Strain CCMP704" /LENGTH=139 /DNA_ID=CAMNT_0026621215 /DNA_START=269 /DNA_END=688 /DNA_ORIENTATION=+
MGPQRVYHSHDIKTSSFWTPRRSVCTGKKWSEAPWDNVTVGLSGLEIVTVDQSLGLHPELRCSVTHQEASITKLRISSFPKPRFIQNAQTTLGIACNRQLAILTYGSIRAMTSRLLASGPLVGLIALGGSPVKASSSRD